jgi:glycosyltransferase involved in cell wall biosynthesis
LALANAAQSAGYEVHVATPQDHVWAPDDFSTEEITRAGFTFHTIPMSRRGTNPFQELKTIFALYRLFRTVKPNLVHLLTIKPILYGGIAARLAGLPAVVASVTGLGQVFTQRDKRAFFLRALVIRLYRLSTSHANFRLIVQNAVDGQILQKAGIIRPQNTFLIRGSGVAMSSFPVTPESPGLPLVILPARLIWEKGVGEFVDAVRLLRRQGVEARFALIGDTRSSNPRAVPQSQIEQWCDEGLVEWWGRRTDMPAVFAQCHIVCLPSSYGEGVPKVLIEAAACGRAIVASDNPGCMEIVRDGENGYVVPTGDSRALAAAIDRLLNAPDLRQKMGRRGHEIASAEFNESLVVESTLAIYREIDPSLARST